MAQVRIKVRPTGLINGREWPEVGEVMELPDAVAESMAESVTVIEPKKVETRPASQAKVEKRGRRGVGNRP